MLSDMLGHLGGPPQKIKGKKDLMKRNHFFPTPASMKILSEVFIIIMINIMETEIKRSPKNLSKA